MAFTIITNGDSGDADVVMQNFRNVNYGNPLLPVTTLGAGVDNTIDLGSSSFGFKVLYCTTAILTQVGIGTDAPGSHSVDADNLVISENSNSGLSIISGTSSRGAIYFGDAVSSGVASRQGQIRYDHSNSEMSFYTAGDNERVTIDANGMVGIGTDAPGSHSVDADNLVISENSNSGLSIISGTSSEGAIYFGDAVSSGVASRQGQIRYDHSDSEMSFYTAGDNKRLVIDNSGNVAIGTGASAGRLHIYSDASGMFSVSADYNEVVVENSGNAGLTFLTPRTDQSGFAFGDEDDNDSGRLFYDHSLNSFNWATDASQRMTLDATGNLGLGVTSLTYELEVQRSSADSIVAIVSGTANNAALYFGDTSAKNQFTIDYDNSLDKMTMLNPSSVGLTISSTAVQVDGTLNTDKIQITKSQSIGASFTSGTFGMVDTVDFTANVGEYASNFIDVALTGDSPGRVLTQYEYYKINNLRDLTNLTVTDAYLFSFERSLVYQECLTTSDKTANTPAGTILMDVDGVKYHVQLYADS